MILDQSVFNRLLAALCEKLNRYEFMFIVAPLRFKNATGSPTNPLAVF